MKSRNLRLDPRGDLPSLVVRLQQLLSEHEDAFDVSYSPAPQLAKRSTVQERLRRLDEDFGPSAMARSMELIAHRGFASQFPENTLVAFSAAIRRGASSLEMDVQPSSDGVLYCFHDTTIDALTSGTGTFTGQSAATINALTFDALAGTVLSSTKVARFADALSIAREAGVRVYPEIKAYRTRSDIDLMVQAVVDAGMEDLCSMQSGTIDDLRYLRTLNQRIEVLFVGAGTTYAANTDFLVPLLPACLLWDNADILAHTDLIAYAYDRGVSVATFTVDDMETARQLMRLGVTRIMSNYSLGSVAP
jgi:glycerophosphoryl diester phosphodiesterase